MGWEKKHTHTQASEILFVSIIVTHYYLNSDQVTSVPCMKYVFLPEHFFEMRQNMARQEPRGTVRLRTELFVLRANRGTSSIFDFVCASLPVYQACYFPFICYFPFVIIVFFSVVLCLTLFTSSGVSVIFIFFQLVLSRVLATSPARGGHDRLFLLVFGFILFFFSLFLFLFRFVYFVPVFSSLIVSFRFPIS